MRMKFGEDMEGLELFPDGMSFRSPFPIEGGRVLEMILCRGSIVVDVMVTHCEHLPALLRGLCGQDALPRHIPWVGSAGARRV